MAETKHEEQKKHDESQQHKTSNYGDTSKKKEGKEGEEEINLRAYDSPLVTTANIPKPETKDVPKKDDEREKKEK